MSFAERIAAAAASNPMGSDVVPIVPGRVLLIDGDGLAYYCAGNDDTEPARARDNLVSKVDAARRITGAESVRILVTGRGSNKGHRYAIATVKPYQGQRVNSRRPRNWEFLRGMVERGWPGAEAHVTHEAEADDLFSAYSARLGAENVVILTQDKDMRMVAGWHLDWLTHTTMFLPKGTFEVVWNDKVYGHKWFWLQMLHGDTADNIPGLPKYVNDKGNLALCGEKTATKLLADCTNNDEAFLRVLGLYRGYYGSATDAALVHFLEQACLLWMREVPAEPLDVLSGPMKKFVISQEARGAITTRCAL